MNKNKFNLLKISLFILILLNNLLIYAADVKNNERGSKLIDSLKRNEPLKNNIEDKKNNIDSKNERDSKLIKSIESDIKKITEEKEIDTAKKDNKKEEKLKLRKESKEKKADEQKKQKIKDKNLKFQLNFENAALRNVLDYIEDIFDVTFFPDDAIGDEKKIKGIADVKMTFKSNKSLTEKQIWNFLDLILENAGLARIQMPGQDLNFYRITQIATANKSNIPLFVGTNTDDLPDYQRIRYMYFVQNRQVTQLKDLIAKLQSKNAQVEIYQDLNVIIITDVAYNIKTLMKIIQELDSAGLPEILSVLKLKNADATDVAKLYESLKGKEDIFRPFGEPKKTGPHLTESTKIIAEPRTNTLIIFGPKESVQRLEDFIKKHIDKELDVQTTKIHVYELNYAPADQIANLLNQVTQFGAESDVAKLGGIRSGEKYLSKMFFEAEKQGNRLIIRSETEEDYKIIKKIIEELDVPQPQVAIEVFIVTITLDKLRGWNSQIRNENLEQINFQTSGFFNQGIQVNTTNNSGSLITNLINLATAATQGTTVLTLGKVSVWAILGILQRTTDAKIIANPFLVATNKYTSIVSLGETRRVKTGTVLGTGGTATTGTDEFGEVQANLSVSITPQINDYGIVNLDIDITIDDFTGDPNPSSPTAGNKVTRKIHTNANVADQEVLALGGLIRDRIVVSETGFPLLSRIPLIGLLFKNKTNQVLKDNLVIFMSPRIIRPHKELVSPYTLNKAERVRLTMRDIDSRTNKRDPIYKWFFHEPVDWDNRTVDRFVLPQEQIEKDKERKIKEGEIKEEEIEKKQALKPKIIQPRRSLTDCVANRKRKVVC